MGAEHQPDKRIALAQLLGHMGLLYHTAAHGDQHLWAAALDVFKCSHIAEHTVNRMLAHGTGVEQDHIRLLRILCEPKAHLCQHPFDMLRIRHILLTAKGTYAGQRRCVRITGFV